MTTTRPQRMHEWMAIVSFPLAIIGLLAAVIGFIDNSAREVLVALMCLRSADRCWESFKKESDKEDTQTKPEEKR